MAVTIFDNFDTPELATAWDRICANLQQPNPFSTRNWLRAWSAAYAATHRPLLICSEQQGQIRAVFPLMVKNDQIMYLADNAADYAQILLDKDAMPDLPDAMRQMGAYFRGVKFKFWNMRSDRLVTDQFIKTVREVARRVNTSSQIIYRVQLPETWNGMMLAIGAKSRESIRRNIHRLRDRGVEFTNTSSITQSELEEIFALHGQRWSLKAQSGQFADPMRRNLWQSILVDRPLPGVRLGRLRLNGDLLAYHLGFEQSGSLLGWGSCFNTAYAKYGPGIVLLSFVVEKCIGEGFVEFDFLRGEEEYKKVWANTTGKIITVDGIFG